MCTHIRYAAGVALALAAIFAVAPRAVAGYDIVVVTTDARAGAWPGVDPAAIVTTDTTTDTTGNLINDALERVNEDGRIILDQGSWTAPTTIITSSVTFMGNPLVTQDKIEVIPSTSTGALFDIRGSGITVILQGFKLSCGGNKGVDVSGDKDAVALDRCWIDGASYGVHSAPSPSGKAITIAVTNSFFGNNEWGIYGSGPNVRVDLVFSTFGSDTVSNSKGALHLDTNATGTVVNTILYDVSASDKELFTDIGATISVNYSYFYDKANVSPGVTLGTSVFDSSQFAPGFVASWWPGKLDASSKFSESQYRGTWGLPSSPLIKDFIAGDFEGDSRSLPYIGADEVKSGASALLWYYCRVTQGNNPEGVVGRGSFNVELRFSGSPSITAAYWVPQGGDTTLANRMDLDVSKDVKEIGGGIFTLQGDVAGTVLKELVPPDGPTQGDLIADGHASIGIEANGLNITGQAKSGRHFLVDTIPPRIAFELVAPSSPQVVTATTTIAYGYPAVSPPNTYAGQFGASAGPLYVPTHPFPLPSGSARQIAPPTSAPYAPYDDGFLSAVPRSSNGPQVFFNIGSLSNTDPAAPPAPPTSNLRVGIRMLFLDPPVTDSTGTMLVSATADPVGENRAPSGFDPVEGGTSDTVEATDLGELISKTQGGLDVVAGQDPTALDGTHVLATYYTSLNNTWGTFKFFVPGGEETPDTAQQAQNTQLAATWTFKDIINDADGIRWAGKSLHTAVRFDVRDRAGNRMGADTTGNSAKLDPVHFWWMVGDTKPQTRIVQNIEGQTLDPSKLTVSWALDRAEEPQITGAQPVPLYSYRLWACPSLSDQAPSGPYVPLGPWSAWSTQRGLGPSDFMSIASSYKDTWLLLTVVGMDEAGNVDPLTDTAGAAELTYSAMMGVDTISVVKTPGRNWRRFKLSDVVDTSVTYRFWNNTQQFGAATLLPYIEGDNLVGEFTVRGTFPASATTKQINWTLYRDGAPVLSNSISAVSQGEVLVSSEPTQDGLKITVDTLGKPGVGAVTYVFQSTAVADTTTADPTPVSVQFTVTPTQSGTSVQDYVKPPHAADDQPITVHENL